MQLSFDFFYDEEFEKYCEQKQINHNLSKFIVLLPEILLIMDTFLKFITGIYVNGVIVTEKKIIIEHYIKKGLIYDLLAYFPIIIQGVLRTNIEALSMNNTIIKLIQMLMFCKSKRVSIALSNFQEIISSSGQNDYILGGFRSMLSILFVTHVNACAWHAVAYFNQKDEVTWLVTSGLIHSDWTKKYLISMYWSASVFSKVGFGENFIPQNNIEYLFGYGSISVAVIMFGYALCSIQEIFELMSAERKHYK